MFESVPHHHNQSMTDGPTTEEATADPPPPAGDSYRRIPLRRSNTDRVVAGVASGIARHFGIDPVIVRLGFVVITLLGGSGVILYLIAWLAIPREDQDESVAMEALRGGRRPGGRSILAVALLVGAILLLSGSVLWWPTFGFADGLFLPLLILAAGVALLVWPSDGYEWHRNWHLDHDEWRSGRSAVRDEWRRERDVWRDSRRQWRHGYRRGWMADEPEGDNDRDTDDDKGPDDGTDDADATTSVTPPPMSDFAGLGSPPPPPPLPAREHLHRPRQPRPKPFLGHLTAALLLLLTGVAVLIDRLGWITFDVGSFLAVCLILIGTVLVLSAFAGRARGLIWLGLLLAPFAWFMTAVDLTWWGGIGEEHLVITDLANLDDEYRWGIGEFSVDLSDLDLEGETRELAVGLTIGELTLYIPASMAVEIDMDGSIGEISISEGGLRLVDHGLDLDLDRTTGDSTGGTLLLDVDLGIGQGEIVICGGQEGVPCPS